ncbi:MAG: PilZ domain-containing protein [Oligoflexales bacterium]|nr:PilZ domain-containing protein [Oligoflexales bacterium]
MIEKAKLAEIQNRFHLFSMSNGEKRLDYEILGISALSVLINSIGKIEPGTILEFRTDNESEPAHQVKVISSWSNNTLEQKENYKLVPLDQNLDLCTLFLGQSIPIKSEHKLTPWKKEFLGKKREFRLTRFVTTPCLTVRANTFGGSKGKYVFSTVNVSKSGMLITSVANQPVPFREGTLLEVNVYAPHFNLVKPISFFAKVVRFTDINDPQFPTKIGIGVVITEFEENEKKNWENLVNMVELSQLDHNIESVRRVG